MDSATCKQCHADIYKEWDSSAHHFSSFNNQWYRQAIVYMQQVDGVQASKWCAGCHDAALFFPGNFMLETSRGITQINNLAALFALSDKLTADTEGLSHGKTCGADMRGFAAP